MKKSGLKMLAVLFLGSVLFSATAAADSTFEVTVTNITKGLTFTPIMVASTLKGDTFFKLGEEASEELETIAETGNPDPLQNSLDSFDSTNSGAMLSPGDSVTQVVATAGAYRYISVAAMLIPTNDLFFAVNGVAGPNGNKTIVVTSPAYDAGTEENDEDCLSLPGPGCGMDPGPASVGEGYVYIANGIRGIEDLDADTLDWRNPVALIKITRLPDDD